jgi:hypothetical protein
VTAVLVITRVKCPVCGQAADELADKHGLVIGQHADGIGHPCPMSGKAPR